jgi:RsiW-degrading membrane proteinase PrsW (M82 family)
VKILVQRGGQTFGPYTEQLAAQYLAAGTLLPQDLARDDASAGSQWVPLKTLLAKSSAASKVSLSSLMSQTMLNLKSFDLQLIFPWKEVTSLHWMQDRKLIYLAAIGLCPAVALAVTGGQSLSYWAIAFYFSSLWALFFYYLFRTKQVETWLCFTCFFVTGVVSIAVLLVLQHLPPWSFFYSMVDSKNFLARVLGMLFGVAINEEICKAAVILWLVRRPGSILMPQTVVFYGMISGLGFGIYEGVNYQQTLNRQQGVDTAYFLNIARLTSLPFLHAVWTGIAAYFIAFAALFPSKRHALWLVAILIPAVLHATYNICGWNIVGLATGLLSVILLMTYLSNCTAMQQHLKKS